jgi:thioredoxin reductase
MFSGFANSLSSLLPFFLPIAPFKMQVAATEILDTLIIGGGPAGLSAALALGRVKRSAVVFDSGVYRNEGVQAMHTVLGNDGTNPFSFRGTSRAQIEAKYDSIQFSNSTVLEVARAKLDPDRYDGFSATLEGGKTYFGRKLIIATGSADILPTDIPGYKENWPSHM